MREDGGRPPGAELISCSRMEQVTALPL